MKPEEDERYAEVSDSLIDTLGQLFNKETGMPLFIEFHGPYAEDKWDDEGIIEEAKSWTNIEEGTGKRGGRVHAHTILEITHYSRIRIDPKAIKDFVDEHMASVPGFKGSYVHSEWIKNQLNPLLSYIRKTEEEPTQEDWQTAIASLKID